MFEATILNQHTLSLIERKKKEEKKLRSKMNRCRLRDLSSKCASKDRLQSGSSSIEALECLRLEEPPFKTPGVSFEFGAKMGQKQKILSGGRTLALGVGLVGLGAEASGGLTLGTKK